ncbi:alpha-1,2-fucosyltransferase [Opitutales bacterium]|nr:alpha-1,2-fucosyltransferase [Opitutales bacterium]
MVTTSIKGGLGNQMFQYAAGYALSQRLETEMQLDLSFYDNQNKRKFELSDLCIDLEVTPSVSTEFKTKLFGFLPKLGTLEKSYVEPFSFYDPLFEKLQSPCLIDGYFQSELYFGSYRKDIIRQYRAKGKITERNKAYLARIKSSTCSVAVHLRRGDYLDQKIASVHGVLTDEYYENAIKILSSMVGVDHELFIFTDDPLFARAKWGADKSVVIVEGNDTCPINDIQLMSACDHNIIANSSFSWWGAWLNQSKGKITVAPRQWFQQDVMRVRNTCDLYLKSWITL